MPRPPNRLAIFPNYKGSAKFRVHKKPRDAFFDDFNLRFPIYSRLPESWRKQHEATPPMLNQKYPHATKRPQLDGLWAKDENGVPQLIEKHPVRVRYTEEVHKGLWGGEGLVTGYKYGDGDPSNDTNWRHWRPSTTNQKFYSEVLERHITTAVTSRAYDLIDEAYGFDHYILKTPVHELCSNFGSSLKREMLLRLLNKDTEMYQNDPETREKIYSRYKKYCVPKEEADWVGLTLNQAMDKQWEIEKESGYHDPTPLLEVYTKDFKEKLKLESNVDDGKNQLDDVADNVAIFHAPKKVKAN